MTLVNARMSFGAADEKWMVELWALNVTDEEYYQVLFDATLRGSSTAAGALRKARSTASWARRGPTV